MVPPIGVVNPLDHFLAPFMFEIDVDVGRFVAFGGNEAFEQQLVLDRIDRGDAEHEADHRIRRRSAPLAQNALAARIAHDRIHRQEIGRIAHMRDQAEFVLEQAGVGRWGRAVEALGERGARHRRQRLLRGALADHDLVGIAILVLQFAQAEGAAFDDRGGGGERARVQLEAARHFGRAFEMAVGAAFAGMAERVDRAAMADRSDDVLQHPPLGHVIQHVARGERDQAEMPGVFVERVEPLRIAGAAMLRQAEMAARAEHIRHPAQGLVVFGKGFGEAGDERGDQPLGMCRDILPMQEALPLLALLRIGAALAERQQPGEAAPAGAILGPDQHRCAIDQIEPTARDEANRADRRHLLGRDQPAHHAADRIAIGDAERGHPGEHGRLKQMLGRGRAAQEAVMRRHLELAPRHPNDPCMNQARSPVSPRSPSPRRNSQKRCPASSSTWK